MITNELISLHPYDTAAQRIYDECCQKFGWSISERGKFGPQRELYAYKVTKEGYSVLFLAHSNWTGDKNGNWKNQICDGIKHIKEHWDNLNDQRFGEKNDIRIVFAKSKKYENKYVFLGIYKITEIDKLTQTKTYELISDKYKPAD